MDLQKTLSAALGENGLSNIANMLGQNTEKSNDTLNTALGFLFQGLQNNATEPKQAEAIISAATDHDTELLNSIIGGMSSGKIDMDDGTKILKHIFGDKTPEVQKTIATNSGVSEEKAGNLLKTLAPLVMTAIPTDKTETTENKLDASSLLKLLSGSTQSATQNSSIGATVIQNLLNEKITNTVASKGNGILSKILGNLFK